MRLGGGIMGTRSGGMYEGGKGRRKGKDFRILEEDGREERWMGKL